MEGLKLKVMEQLKAQLTPHAAVSAYMDQIMVTVPEHDFEEKEAAINREVQALIDAEPNHEQGSLCVLLCCTEGHHEKNLKFDLAR